VDVQTRDGRSRNHPAIYGSTEHRAEQRSSSSAWGAGAKGHAFLEHFEGILQTDAYAAYDRVGGPKMVHAACWAHSRRRFVEATKLNQQDVASARIVAQMAKLLPSMLRRVTRTWTMPRVTCCAWNGLRWCSQNSRRRSRLPAERHSHRVPRRQLPTRFGCGTSSHASSTIQSWS